jgi:hypothetical protein
MNEQLVQLLLWIMGGWASLTFAVQIWNVTEIRTLRNLVGKLTASDTGQVKEFEGFKQQLEELRAQLDKLDETAKAEREHIWAKIRKIEAAMNRCRDCSYNR